VVLGEELHPKLSGLVLYNWFFDKSRETSQQVISISSSARLKEIEITD